MGTEMSFNDYGDGAHGVKKTSVPIVVEQPEDIVWDMK